MGAANAKADIEQLETSLEEQGGEKAENFQNLVQLVTAAANYVDEFKKRQENLAKETTLLDELKTERAAVASDKPNDKDAKIKQLEARLKANEKKHKDEMQHFMKCQEEKMSDLLKMVMHLEKENNGKEKRLQKVEQEITLSNETVSKIAEYLNCCRPVGALLGRSFENSKMDHRSESLTESTSRKDNFQYYSTLGQKTEKDCNSKPPSRRSTGFMDSGYTTPVSSEEQYIIDHEAMLKDLFSAYLSIKTVNKWKQRVSSSKQ